MAGACVRMDDDAHMSTMDDYLSGVPPDEKATLERVRTVVFEIVPEAEEGRSYGMPAFIYARRPLLGFRVAKKHLSIFPFSAAAIDAVRERLGDFGLAKGTIRFTPDKPVPEDVLADLVRARLHEIAARR
jgi:uncharacterized protein YdhG (YjbR/CyaY superfamily)